MSTFPWATSRDERPFFSHLEGRLCAQNQNRAPESLGNIRGADVFLAWACSAGNQAALASFEQLHAADLRAVWFHARGNKPPLDDFVQAVRTKLFVGPCPRIAEYSGFGKLRNWLRVSATRLLVDFVRAAKDEARLQNEGESDAGALALPAPGDDPELAYLKHKYRHEMKEAFEQAAGALDAEERNVLREHYAHGLGIDQIAQVHGIHRATAARRLARARDMVIKNTRQLLMQRLKISRAELESVVRLIESQMHVTVERVLAAR